VWSDKGMSFMSRLFGHVTKMLGIKHKTGAALNPRANCYAEQIIKRVNEMLMLLHARCHATSSRQPNMVGLP